MDKIMHDPSTQSLGRAVVDYTSGPSPEALKSKFNTVMLAPVLPSVAQGLGKT